MKNLKLKKKQSFREKISWKIAYGLKPLYLFLRRNRKPWNVTVDSLSKLPEDTLGRDVSIFLKRYNLEVIPMAEFHDVCHVLFNYGTSIKDEACVQFVPLGNGRLSLPYLACTFISALFYPENWKDFYSAYCRGKKANKFHDWNFKELLETNTETIRKMIFDK